mgnify:FL=1|jgi:hypothetical protein|tara:strand:- start:320 stop:508 length:189 start_codon:yes stop_codon:yes gene_type:complete
MSYIIVHVEDEKDLESMEVLPDSKGKGVQQFDSKIEASEFLMKIGMGTDLWFNRDIHIVRIH